MKSACMRLTSAATLTQSQVTKQVCMKHENHDAIVAQTGCWADAARLSQDTTEVCTDRHHQLRDGGLVLQS